MKHQAGKVSVIGTGTVVAFSGVMDSVNYSIGFRCYNPLTLETIGCTIDPALYTTIGFTAVPMEDAVLEYQATEFGTATLDERESFAGRVSVFASGTTVVFPRTLSTVGYALVFRCYDPTTLETLGCTVDPAFYTTSGFQAVPLADGVLEYQVETYGSPITLIGQSGRLSRDWSAQRWYAELVRDLGLTANKALYGERFNIINRAIPKSVSVHSALLGNAYKSSQVSTDIVTAEVLIGAIRMQMGGPEQRMAVESSATVYVDMVEFEEYRLFRAGAYQNTGRIVWVREGDSLLFKKSSSLADFGSRTYRYSRMPEECTGNEEMIDFADSFMHLTFVEGKKVLAERYQDIVGPLKFPEDAGEVATKKAAETAQLEEVKTLQKAL